MIGRVSRSPGLATVVYESAADVAEEAWRAATPEDFFFDLEFLRVMETSRVEDASYRYLLLTRSGEPVGAAVLSTFVLRLDLLSGDPWVKRIRRWIPSVLDLPIVCCGVPASFGQHHVHVVDPALRAPAAAAVDRAMALWAESTGCGALVWKEWSAGQGFRDPVRALGYELLPTLPDHVIDPLPDSTDSFLASMRSSYRRRYREALRLHGERDGSDPAGPLALCSRHLSERDVPEFYRGYRAVLDRTAVRLETYPQAFFSALARSDLAATILSLTHRDAGEKVEALIMPDGDTLFFLLLAKDRARYEADLYPLLLRCIVLDGLSRGSRRIRLGQTSAYAKVSAGARPRRLETFIRLRRPWKHRLLKRFGSVLFPPTSGPDLRVYKQRPSAEES